MGFKINIAIHFSLRMLKVAYPTFHAQSNTRMELHPFSTLNIKLRFVRQRSHDNEFLEESRILISVGFVKVVLFHVSLYIDIPYKYGISFYSFINTYYYIFHFTLTHRPLRPPRWLSEQFLYMQMCNYVQCVTADVHDTVWCQECVDAHYTIPGKDRGKSVCCAPVHWVLFYILLVNISHIRRYISRLDKKLSEYWRSAFTV